MSRIHFTRIAPAVALAILAGCSSPSDGAPANSQQVQAPQEVTVARPETRRITQRITLTATIEAYEQVALYAKVAGYVKTLDVDIADRVRAGQLLATLEVPKSRANSDARRATRSSLKSSSRGASGCGPGKPSPRRTWTMPALTFRQHKRV